MALIRKSISIWILCEFIILPFSYSYLPSIGSYFHWLVHPGTNWFYQVFYSNNAIIDPTISDSASSFIAALFLIPIILGTVIIVERGSKKEISIESTELLVLYFLSFFLLRYGMDKVLGNQFQTPEPNILNAKVGDLSKDMLFWTSMGTSSIYNQFLGWSEVITSIFLLVPKFRKLGLYLSCGIFTNVLFINIGFDISVKFLSGLLLFTSGWLLLLFRFERLKTPIKHAYIVHGIGLFLFLEITLSSIQIVNKSQTQPTGSYIVASSKTDKIPEKSALHLNSKGYLIIQNEDNFSSHTLIRRGKQFELSLNRNTVQTCNVSNDTCRIHLSNDTVIAIKSTKNYLLLQDNTHWMVEHF